MRRLPMPNILPFLWFLVVATQGGCDNILLGAKASPTPGVWSSKGIYLSYGLGALDCPGIYRIRDVPSPNSKYKIHLSSEPEFTASVQENAGAALERESAIKLPTLSEILWSDDSSAFAVTSCDGGWVGGWSVKVFMIRNGQTRRVDVSGEASTDVMRRYKCAEREGPNFGAVAWMHGAGQLVLVAQVPPHSSCRDMGKLFGYMVSVPRGGILRRYSESELRNTWGAALGERLTANN